MTKREMEFIIECLERYQDYITDDCRMTMKHIKEDPDVFEQWIMSKKLIKVMETQIKKQKRKK
tara:strand:+ start:67 stop:255 length:189 start_codon:yes stop_codon:yes gene_type:complete